MISRAQNYRAARLVKATDSFCMDALRIDRRQTGSWHMDVLSACRTSRTGGSSMTFFGKSLVLAPSTGENYRNPTPPALTVQQINPTCSGNLCPGSQELVPVNAPRSGIPGVPFRPIIILGHWPFLDTGRLGE
jgi:hypothetical protein